MRHLGTDEEGGGGPGHSSHDQRAGGARGEERGEDLQVGERGHQQVHDGALQLHDEQRRAGVEERVVDDAEHHQARHEEADVGHPFHLAQPSTEGPSEDDEVERGGDQGREDGLPGHAQEALHFLLVQRAHPERRFDRRPRRRQRRDRPLQRRGSVRGLGNRRRRVEQLDDHRLQPRFPRLHVVDPQPRCSQRLQRRGKRLSHPRREHHRGAPVRQRRAGGGERRRQCPDRLLQGETDRPPRMPRDQLLLVLDHEQPAVLDHADAVGELLGFLEIVRGQHDGRAAFRELAHVRPEIASQLDVDARGRLVEEEHRRIVHQRLGDQEAPLHSAGECSRIRVALVAQPEISQDRVDAGAIQPYAEIAGLEPERLFDGEEGIEVDLLRDQTDGAAGEAIVAHDVAAEHLHGAFAGERGSRHQADQGRLSGPIGAEQREDLAAVDVEVDVIESGEGAVALGRAAQAHRFRHDQGRMPQRRFRCAAAASGIGSDALEKGTRTWLACS